VRLLGVHLIGLHLYHAQIRRSLQHRFHLGSRGTENTQVWRRGNATRWCLTSKSKIRQP